MSEWVNSETQNFDLPSAHTHDSCQLFNAQNMYIRDAVLRSQLFKILLCVAVVLFSSFFSHLFPHTKQFMIAYIGPRPRWIFRMVNSVAYAQQITYVCLCIRHTSCMKACTARMPNISFIRFRDSSYLNFFFVRSAFVQPSITGSACILNVLDIKTSQILYLFPAENNECCCCCRLNVVSDGSSSCGSKPEEQTSLTHTQTHRNEPIKISRIMNANANETRWKCQKIARMTDD